MQLIPTDLVAEKNSNPTILKLLALVQYCKACRKPALLTIKERKAASCRKTTRQSVTKKMYF